MAKFRVLSPYASGQHRFEAGAEVDVTDEVGRFLLADSRETFEPIDKAAEALTVPVPDTRSTQRNKAPDGPPADKQVRAAFKK